ncbi:hypothetical protein QAD02_007751 [Eretmocerus hayati]|uniref:Uncharacterized protein n=1 Tax=Eretmocerus hayati TaxID=131215 RepID=A0ACC2N4W8_9HYME|nr:hypothetical protein QAD02_007751 [Eretmocerus hayati]
MFGTLYTSSGASSFTFNPASTAGLSGATPTSTISFGSPSATPNAAASSFRLAALMNSSVATLGTLSSTAARSRPSVNIFTNEAATNRPAAASPMFEATTSTIPTSIFDGSTTPITTSSINKSPRAINFLVRRADNSEERTPIRNPQIGVFSLSD